MQVKAKKIHKEKGGKVRTLLVFDCHLQDTRFTLSLTLMANLIQGTKREYKKTKKITTTN